MNTKSELKTYNGTTYINVLLIFDSIPAGKHGKELYDRLGHRFDPGVKVQLCLWSTAMLDNPELAQAAAVEATHAALMIIAINGNHPLTAPVRSCLQKCVRRLPGDSSALVVQLDGVLKMNEETTGSYRFLKKLADQTGAGFFSEVVELSDEETDCSIESIHRSSHMSTLMPGLPELVH